MAVNQGGQTFSMEGHIKNFIVIGPHIYYVYFNYNLKRMKI